MMPPYSFRTGLWSINSSIIFKEPQRGDVIVFDPPEECTSKWIISRGHPLPGYKVEVKQGKVI